jgi:hypothetical protein
LKKWCNFREPKIIAVRRVMKLLVIFPSTLRGGAEKYTLTIAAAIKRGWNVRAVFPKTDKTTSLINDFSANNVWVMLQACWKGIKSGK